MRLYGEIFKDADGGALSRCTLVPKGGGYFEGVKAVEAFSSTRIVLCFPQNSVEVEGKNLSVKKYCDGDLHLVGEILRWQVRGAELDLGEGK